ncbi:hypothetical protein K9N68_01550 [Kovacikia minuta CCNUW1]|uniref:dual OB domain-containing protein n=1 Tax=Kovacikia minuta TaxID=2931930 RepID=UPI001CCD99CC|nr:hypothetical protein [Kovacikia minuta]UBF26715.1 hypothetical protein K9N68_01550 [Kovacikia minuta CCNUW1]
MTQIICLANSWKRGERCIAGIELTTGKWIRPVSDLSDGRVPWYVRTVEGREPELLDFLEIPLANTAPAHWNFEQENRSILPGEWRRLGQVQPTDLLPYCNSDRPILHNCGRNVTVPYLCSLPFPERYTLQLNYVKEFSVKRTVKVTGRCKWMGNILTDMGYHLTELSITDPAFVERLEAGYRPQNPCLVTVSLSLPFCSSDVWQADAPCWKLIAGVIELSGIDLILVEVKRLGWSIEQGREHLQRYYQKRSRKQLTVSEITHCLNYLQSLPTPSRHFATIIAIGAP